MKINSSQELVILTVKTASNVRIQSSFACYFCGESFAES